MAVDPWKVEGKMDYDRLVKEFGTQKIDDSLMSKLSSYGKLPALFRRGFVFSHRDLNLVLKDYDNKKGFFLYTGRAPANKMHIGHAIPMVLTKFLQDLFDVNLYIQFPDEEKFLAKAKHKKLEDVDAFVEDNLRDVAAIGFNPEKTFIFRNREYTKHMYTTAVQIAKKVTFSKAKAVFGFKNESNIGFIFYPAMQMVPTFFEDKRCLIPAAIDQDPYWRIQRDLAQSLGGYKTAAIHSKFLPPLTGMEGKMSSSIGETAIYMDDDEKTVRKKVMKQAFSGGQSTIEEHRKKGGNPDIDVSFQWLNMFFEEDDAKIKKIYEDYTSGKLLTGELKQILVDKLNAFLAEHQKRKSKVDKNLKKMMYSGRLAKQMWSRE